MDGLLPPAELADLRADIGETLTEQLTNSRTGLTTSCRIGTAMRRGTHLEGLPSFLTVQRWQIVQLYGTDVAMGDRLTSTDGGTYVVTEAIIPGTLAIEVSMYALEYVTSATASVERLPGPQASFTAPVPNNVALATITLRSFTSRLLTPMSPQYMLDTFGVSVAQPAWTVVDIPAGHPEHFPIRQGDRLRLNGATYMISAVEPAPGFLLVYVEVKTAS